MIFMFLLGDEPSLSRFKVDLPEGGAALVDNKSQSQRTSVLLF